MMIPDSDWMQWKDVVDAPMSVEVWELPYRVQDFRVYLLPGPIVWAHWIGWTLPSFSLQNYLLRSSR